MPKMETDEKIKEREAQIKALHQWAASQNIPQHEWGPLFAAAAGYEVYRVQQKHKGTETQRLGGLYILNRLADIYSLVGLTK